MENDLLSAVRELIEIQRTASVPLELRYADAEQLGALLGYSGRTVAERMACLPDFPAPVRLLGGAPRWKVSEVIAWADAQRKPRRARKINQAA